MIMFKILLTSWVSKLLTELHELRHRLVTYMQNPKSMYLVEQFPQMTLNNQNTVLWLYTRVQQALMCDQTRYDEVHRLYVVLIMLI